MTNLDIIKSTYESANPEENAKNLAFYAAADISWTEAKGFIYAGTYIGLDSVFQNVFSRIGSEWTNFKFTPENYVASDDKVVAYGTYTGTYKQTGKSISARVVHLWTLENSKIIRFEQFVDSQTVSEALH